MFKRKFVPPLLNRPPQAPPLSNTIITPNKQKDAEQTNNKKIKVDSTSEDSSAVEEGKSRYFNVLWRKPTTKKNKTWDGDGILTVSISTSSLTNAAYMGTLHDEGGRDMGRRKLDDIPEIGDMLVMSGKEVEIDGEMKREEYLAGRRFLNQGAPIKKVETKFKAPGGSGINGKVQDTVKCGTFAPTVVKKGSSIKANSRVVPVIKNPASNGAMPLPQLKNKGFRTPMLSTTEMPNAGKMDAIGEPVPRHNPKAPNALVMKRPLPCDIKKGKQIVDVVVDPLLCKYLRPHQREGVAFLYEAVMGMRGYNGDGAILADEMGLGKTLQTIALLWTLMKQNPIYEAQPVVKKALIVCPVTLINNWLKEFRKWLGMERVGVFVANAKSIKNIKNFTFGKVFNIMIVGYERLRNIQADLEDVQIDIIIADEGHRLKTAQNKSAQAIKELVTTRRVILSGTPLQNDLSEFYVMADFVNPGILGTPNSFKKEFELPILKSRQPNCTKADKVKGEARSEELATLTKEFILRRTADILSKYLPPKTEYVVFCRPTSVQVDCYNKVLESPLLGNCMRSTESALPLITMLKKVCNSPALLAPKPDAPKKSDDIGQQIMQGVAVNILKGNILKTSGKLKVLNQMLATLKETTGEKIVLVSNYTSTLDILQNMLSSKGYTFMRLDGKTPTAKRQEIVDSFNRLDSDKAFAFLLSSKSGGTGINLIGASRLVLFDSDWNPANDLQSMARVHRDGQKSHVFIYRLLTTGCLDEKIYQRQVAKRGLADSVLDQKSNLSGFSQTDLRDLFSLDTETSCSTHDLLECHCGGNGEKVLFEDDDAVEEENNGDDNDDDDDENDGLPDVKSLLKKASEVDMEQIEASVRGDNSKANKMKSLFQYTHIDPKRLKVTPESPAVVDSNDEEDVEESLLDFERIKEVCSMNVDILVEDTVLRELLKEDKKGRNISYLFAK